MKIRNDFVSNSSSVSYIITMKKDLVESMASYWKGHRSLEVEKITNFLIDDLVENGTRVYLDGEEIYFKKVKFNTDGDTIDKEYLESEGKEIDFNNIDDAELWSYIYGEYLLRCKLGAIEGFGSTQVDTY